MEHLKIKFNGQEKIYPQQITTIADLLHENIQQQGNSNCHKPSFSNKR